MCVCVTRSNSAWLQHTHTHTHTHACNTHTSAHTHTITPGTGPLSYTTGRRGGLLLANVLNSQSKGSEFNPQCLPEGILQQDTQQTCLWIHCASPCIKVSAKWLNTKESLCVFMQMRVSHWKPDGLDAAAEKMRQKIAACTGLKSLPGHFHCDSHF